MRPDPGSDSEGITDLPYAQGKRFRTLDEYLAHRRELGAYDTPMYTEVEPGVYELWGGRKPPGVEAPRFTRAELLAEFGFTE